MEQVKAGREDTLSHLTQRLSGGTRSVIPALRLQAGQMRGRPEEVLALGIIWRCRTCPPGTAGDTLGRTLD